MKCQKGLELCSSPSKFVVRPERFELPTHRFVACCSIQLSHGRAVKYLLYHSPQAVNNFYCACMTLMCLRLHGVYGFGQT